MKYILILLVLVGGYWYYSNIMKQEKMGEDLISQLSSGNPVSIEQVKIKANEIVSFLCKDSGFQSSIGSSVSECESRYSEFKEMCENRIFDDSSAVVKTEQELKDYTSRYRKCIIKNT